MKTFQFILFCSLLVLMSSCSILPKGKTALKPPLIKPVEQNFAVAEVKRGTISKELKNSAEFVSSKKQDLFFNSSGGRLQNILVKVGDTVKKGDVLAQLDSEDFESQVFVQKRVLEKATIAYQQSELLTPNDTITLHLQKIDVELARNELNHLSDLLIKTKLIATIDGKVTFVSELKEGDYVTAYETVVSISDPKQVQLVSKFSIPSDLNVVKVGMKVDVVADDKTFSGHILQAPSSVPLTDDRNQQSVNQTSLVIGVDELPEGDLIGNIASIVITLVKKENALIIPQKTLSTFLGRTYVHILVGGIRKEIDVETGISDSTNLEITKGLKEGQKVIFN
ncbi:MAG: family efflux transporter, subunit [Bacilli bacterium]|nr:family efflux transporter, subunit [Bacilli bacterium]